MNAIELFHKDGRSSGIYFCEKCRKINNSQLLAEQCCKPYMCSKCGKESGRPYIDICLKCERIHNEEREIERFNKAEKLKESEYSGWVFADNYGYNDGFFEDIEALKDCIWDEIELPKYVYPCVSNQIVDIGLQDIFSIIDSNEPYEGFSFGCLDGLNELKAALEEFCDKNKNLVSYSPDYKRVIILDKE